MELMNSSYNIINKVLDKNINILYEPTNDSFDSLMASLPINIVSKNNNMNSCLYYDCILLNNWQKHITNRTAVVSKHQIIDILVFHDPCPDNFKKEDKIILQNNLKTAYKIFPTAYINQTWSIKGEFSIHINYGIPFIVENNTPQKNIIVVNTSKNEIIFSLYRFLKNIYPDTDILVETYTSDDFIQKLKEYKIVIDLTNSYNNLLAVASGAQVITNSIIDTNLMSPIIIQDISVIPNIIADTNTLYRHSKSINNDQKYLIKQYNIDTFRSSMTNILQKIKMEPFTL